MKVNYDEIPEKSISLSPALAKALSQNEKSRAIGGNLGFTKVSRIVGQTPPIPKQKRNAPCGCGSGVKAKKCCGIYPRQRSEP